MSVQVKGGFKDKLWQLFVYHRKLEAMDASAYCSQAIQGVASVRLLPFSDAKTHLPSSFSFLQTSKRRQFCRLRISQNFGTPLKHEFWMPRISCSVIDDAGIYSESGEAAVSSDSSKDAVIDIKLPRRSLLVKFTCKTCGVRSQKLINRLAYERGTVFLECSGCFQYHKLVDNLGLVVEYDFRKDVSGDSNADQA